MFNDDEYTSEDRAAGIWGTLLVMACIGSCANMPKDANQDKKPQKIPVKIEHRENITTNQLSRISCPYILVR